MSGVFLVKTGQGAVYLVLTAFISLSKELLTNGINLGRHFETLFRHWSASKILDEKLLPAANNVKLQPCGWNMLTSIRLQLNVSKWNNSSRSKSVITLKINLIWYLVWYFHHNGCRCYISISQSALQSNIQVTSVPFGLKLCCTIKGHCLIRVIQHQWEEFKVCANQPIKTHQYSMYLLLLVKKKLTKLFISLMLHSILSCFIFFPYLSVYS